MSELLDWLATREGAPLDTLRDEISRWLADSDRVLVRGRWYGDDVEEAYACLSLPLTKLGIPPFSMGEFERRHAWVKAQVADEEERRRHQIGFAATYANAHLEGPRRFHCLGVTLEIAPDEPVWVLVEQVELDALAAVAGPLRKLEAHYSGQDRAPQDIHVVAESAASAELLANEAIAQLDLNWSPTPTVTMEEVSIEEADVEVDVRASTIPPATAELLANEAIAEHRYEDALTLLSRVSEEGDFGLLVRLKRIRVLIHADKMSDAARLWSETVKEWLQEDRRVWHTHWRTLVELYGELGLTEEHPRLAAVRLLARPTKRVSHRGPVVPRSEN